MKFGMPMCIASRSCSMEEPCGSVVEEQGALAVGSGIRRAADQGEGVL